MARSARPLVALLLSILLPLSGMAGPAAPIQPCPMHQMEMPEGPGMEDSCCDQERSAALGYKVCKPGQENCHAPVLFTIPAVSGPAIPTAGTTLATFLPDLPRSNAESFWRPPRA